MKKKSVLFSLLVVLSVFLCLIQNTENALAARGKNGPEAPQVSITIGDNGNPKVTWTKVEGAESYRVYRMTSNDEQYVRIATTKKLEFTDSDWDAPKNSNIKYFVRVANKDANGDTVFGQISEAASWKVPKKMVKLSANEKEMLVGDKGKLKLYHCTDTITWSSSDTSVVKVSQNGVLLAVKRGTSDIIAKVNGISYICKVTVEIPAPGTRQLDPTKPIIALSYDDGPSIYTPQILEILTQYGATATFFEVGTNVTRYPDTVLAVYQAGCEVANHTINHPNLKTLSRDKIISEIDGNKKKINNVLGEGGRIFRPPYGNYNDTVKEVVGAPIITWSVDTRDWESRNAEKVFAEVKRSARDGAIILMHDLYKSTAEATVNIVPWLVEQGYQICSVSEMFAARGITMENGAVYNSCKVTAGMYAESHK